MEDKGIKGLTVTFDSFDEVVRKELQETIVTLLDPTNDPNEKPSNTLNTVDGFFVVLDWYSKPSEYQAFRDKVKPEYDKLVSKVFTGYMSDGLEITVTNIRDLPDGSANIEYEATPEMKEFLMGVGLQKLLIDAVNQQEDNTEVSTEDNSWDYWNA